MIRKILFGFLLAVLVLPPFFLGGLGGCGGGGGGGSSSRGDTGEASVASLSSVPSVDISNLDYSQSSSDSGSLSALALKEEASSNPKKGLGHGLNQVGNPSRAGCESNMHKKEIIRHSQEAQLDRCYPEALERAGFITIPSGSFAYYLVSPPADSGDDREKACDGIPEDHTDEIAACKSGDEGPGGGDIKVRIGRFDNELRVDMCEGDHGLVNEGTYSADGSVYSILATRIGKFGGHDEASSFSATVDLGTDGTVTDAVVDLGSTGTAHASSAMSGRFGNGTMTFDANGSDQSNTLSGVFNGGFTDPRTKTATTFTGKAYAQFGGSSNTGCAKFSFTGAPPPMKVSDMIPFDIPAAQLANFLQSFGAQLGITLNATNKDTVVLCPNPDFNPENPDATSGVAPMVVGDAAAGCKTVTHSGVECFSITNGIEEEDFGSEVVQVFTIIENSGSPFFTAVNAFDLSTLNSTVPVIAFTRDWDCTGTFTALDFAAFTPDQLAAADEELQTCFALEEKTRNNEGMGGYNCHEQQEQGDINNFAENGPPTQGKFAGDCLVTGGTCPKGRDHFFFNPVDPDKNIYCAVTQGNCGNFTVTGTGASGLSIKDPDGSTITAINYTQSGTDPATKASVTMTVGGKVCTAECSLSQPKFDKPPDFTASGGGTKPGDAGFIPKSCMDAGLTTEAACRAHCEDTHDCRD